MFGTTSATSLLALLALLVPPLQVAAADSECIVAADGLKFDFGPLKGSSTVTTSVKTPPSINDMTWYIDPCGALTRPKDTDAKSFCPDGTHICGIEIDYPIDAPANKTIHKIIPIAGDFDGDRKLNPTITRIKKSTTDTNSEDGVKIEYHGGLYFVDPEDKKQSAIVEYICDKEKTGLEGQEREKKDKRDDKKEDKSLRFVSYSDNVLKLQWRTKQACEQAEGGGEDGSGGAHWGFFTWFVIIIFMGTAAYLIFYSWFNYNHYGMRGWDILPHADALKDVPYLVKEFVRKVTQTLQGSGSRAGYSAV